MTNRTLSAAILNANPPVTISKRAPSAGLGLGLSGLCPDQFAGGPSFHILTLAWSHENAGLCEGLRDELLAMQNRLPLARYLVLASTAHEAAMLREHGITTLHANVLCLADTERYVPTEAPRDEARFDAVYVAGFQKYKRHGLAAKIPKLLLVYWEPDFVQTITMRQTLPEAVFANHDAGDGSYRFMDGSDYSAQLGRASVGLCLSAEEGPMRASIEYMLCGLPVVTTEAKGGRLEMLSGPYQTIVPPEPEAIAEAVRAYCSAPPDPSAVREAILNKIMEERRKLLEGVNSWLLPEAGLRLGTDAMQTMIEFGTWRARPLQKVLLPLKAYPN
jgi:glycosyltransferase involved in cell wall biosynthesis